MTLTTTQAHARTAELDIKQSQIKWTGKKITGQKHEGTIGVKAGKVELDGQALKGGEILIDMASIKNEDIKDPKDNAQLTGHLKSDDFFGVAKHSTAKFKITSVKPLKGVKDATHEIAGQLTIKGVTHPATFPAKVEITDGGARAKGKLVVDRTLYDIRYGSGKFFENLGDKMISDSFELDIDLKAKS